MSALPDAYSIAIERLANEPDDPSLNLTVGIYLVFARNDWDQGLSHLVRGSDDELRIVSDMEVKSDGVSDCAHLARRWLLLSKRSNPVISAGALRHSIFWYEKAMEAPAHAAS